MYDDADHEVVSKHSWHIIKSFRTFYAQTNYYPEGVEHKKVNRRSIKMHQILLKTQSSDIIIDHKDGNGLNNQRKNIRTCTQQENAINKGSVGAIKYKGVYQVRDKYRTAIKKGKQRINLGYYNTPKDAAKAYNIKAVELFGEFAFLNSI